MAASIGGPFLTGDRGKDMTWRELLWYSLDDPTLTRCAQLTAWFITAMIIVSVACLVLETLPSMRHYPEVFFVFEVVATSIFTLEIVAKLVSCPRPSAMLRIMNVVDFVAILPLYLELVISSDSSPAYVLRAFRLLRIFRLFKLSRYFGAIKLLTSALYLSAAPLSMAMFLTLLGVILFASAMYYIERGDWNQAMMRYEVDNQASKFQSVLDAMWFTAISVTTVGYGDLAPLSGQGKALGALVALGGVVILGFPISIFSANFSDLYVLSKRRAALRKELQVDLTQTLVASTKESVEISLESIPMFENPHLPTPASTGTGAEAPSAEFFPDSKSSHTTALAAPPPRSPEDLDKETIEAVFAPSNRNLSHAVRGGRSASDGGSDWSRSITHDAREAKSLKEAIKIARTARLSQMLSFSEDDKSILRASSFEDFDLTDDGILSEVMASLCRDTRRRIWNKIRRLECQMSESLAEEVAKRWLAWFGSDIPTLLQTSGKFVRSVSRLRHRLETPSPVRTWLVSRPGRAPPPPPVRASAPRSPLSKPASALSTPQGDFALSQQDSDEEDDDAKQAATEPQAPESNADVDSSGP
jgi:voltage-gated potassium channel